MTSIINNSPSVYDQSNWYTIYPNGPYWIVPDFVYPYNPPLTNPQPFKLYNNAGFKPIYTVNDYPEVNIMVNNNRVRRVENSSNNYNVYLNEGEFAIEIFNKSQFTLGAKIKLNGKYISNSHIIVYPAQRLVLDRFIDSKDKLKFTVYTVDANNKQVDQIIKDNGSLEIEFYEEYQQPQSYVCSGSFGHTGSNNIYYVNSNLNGLTGTSYGTTTTVANNNLTFTASNSDVNFAKGVVSDFQKSLKTEKETGIVDKGGKSDQNLTYVNKTFNIWLSSSVKFKLLPMSEKPIESRDLVVHCTSCGHKAKKHHKFCSNCGTKIE